MAVNGNGSAVYIAGYTDGTLNSTASTNPRSDDAYMASFNSNGTLNWINRFGSFGSVSAQDIVIDSSGDLFLVTMVAGSVDGLPFGGGNPSGVIKIYRSFHLCWCVHTTHTTYDIYTYNIEFFL